MIERGGKNWKTSVVKLFSKYANSDIIKVSSKNSIQVVIKLLAGVLNIKIISVMLGSSGMVIISQFFNVIQFYTNLANGGIIHGVTKLTAHYDYSCKRVKLIIGNAFVITISFSFIISVLLFFNGDAIAKNFLYDKEYGGIIRGTGFLIFSLAMNSVLLAFINGLQQNRKYILLNCYSAIITVIVVIPFVYFWNIKGAMYAQFISGFIILGISVFFVRKRIPKVKELCFSLNFSKRLLNFGVMLLFASSLKPLTRIFSRHLIVNHCSLNEAGWWDGINKISTTYSSVITTALALYFLPKISKSLNYQLISYEIRKSLFIILPIVVACSLFIFLLRSYIVAILFTDQFVGMNDLFLFQCLGDVIKISSWFFAITIILKEKVKFYISLEILIALIIPLNVFLCINFWGIKGTSIAYFFNNFIYLVLSVLIYLKISSVQYVI